MDWGSVNGLRRLPATTVGLHSKDVRAAVAPGAIELLLLLRNPVQIQVGDDQSLIPLHRPDQPPTVRSRYG